MKDANTLLRISQQIGELQGKVDCIEAGVGELKGSVASIDSRLRRIEIRSTTVASVVATGCAGLAHLLGLPAGPGGA